MDFFKYIDDINLSFIGAEPITGIDSASWIERYREPGEFEIKARLSSGLKTFLPMGSLISHVNTMDIMIVENREISEEVDSDPIIKITGRSFETYLQHRIVGQNQNFASPPATLDSALYQLPSQSTSYQAVQLIREHIVTGVTLSVDNALPNVEAVSIVNTVGGEVAEPRVIKRGSLHERLIELLEFDDLGIRVNRRNKFFYAFNSSYTHLVIHNGQDKSNSVVFSSKAGDISSADYLWTTKHAKNCALVTGKFVETMVFGIKTGYKRRVLFVDGSDLDGHLTAVPTGTALTDVRNRMAVRGRRAIKAHRELFLTAADVSVTPTYRYRTDYNIGDIVSIDGTYGENERMRVVEHAEIEDETGESSHPTLQTLEDG